MSEELTELANELGPVSGRCSIESDRETVTRATSALRRLAAAGEQEPVAWGRVIGGMAVTVSRDRSNANDEPLFTAPQPAPGWDEAIEACKQIVMSESKNWQNTGYGRSVAKRIADELDALRSAQSTSDAGGVNELACSFVRKWDATSDAGGGVREEDDRLLELIEFVASQRHRMINPDLRDEIIKGIQALSTPAAADSNASSEVHHE